MAKFRPLNWLVGAMIAVLSEDNEAPSSSVILGIEPKVPGVCNDWGSVIIDLEGHRCRITIEDADGE